MTWEEISLPARSIWV